MLDYLLLFLGIKSWNVNYILVKKTKIKFTLNSQQKQIKTVKNLKLLDNDTPSPILDTYNIVIENEVSFRDKIFYIMYTFYYVFILCIITIQPMYTLIKFINNIEDITFLYSFFLHINLPMIFIWEKFYFRTDHYEKFLNCKSFKSGLIIISSLLSYVVNFLDLDSFYNEYYWLSNIESNILFYILIIIEWTYARVSLFLFIYLFMFILHEHIRKIKRFKKELENNEFDFENNTCLSNIIKEISIIRHNLEITIDYYNNIISYTTLVGGIGLMLFIRNILSSENILSFEEHDRYLVHPVILYIVTNLILIINMLRYSYRREEILKYIKSMSFMNKFIIRMSTEDILKKSKKNINLANFNISEETATTLDWLILGNIVSEKWLDFSVIGISTADGDLIKKAFTFGSILLVGISILQNNN